MVEILTGQAGRGQGWRTRLGAGLVARLTQRPTVGEALEVIESSAAAVLELRAGARAGVVEPPGGWPHPEHGTPRGRGRRETLRGDLGARPGTIARGWRDVVSPGLATAQLVLPVRTVRVPVAADTGGQEDPPGAPQTPEVT